MYEPYALTDLRSYYCLPDNYSFISMTHMYTTHSMLLEVKGYLGEVGFFFVPHGSWGESGLAANEFLTH